MLTLTFSVLSIAITAVSSGIDPVDLRVRLMGPSGPLAHVWMEAEYGKGKKTTVETDESGWAVWHLDREVSNRVAVDISAPSRLENELNSDYSQRLDTYWARFAGISLPRPVLYELSQNGATDERTFTCSRGIVLSFGPVTNPGGTFPSLVRLLVPGTSPGSAYDDTTGLGNLAGVPADTTSVAYLRWAEPDNKGRIMRIAVPSSQADTTLGAIQVPAPVARTATINLKRIGLQKLWPARAFAGVGQVGATLVSANGAYMTGSTYGAPAVDSKMTKSVSVPPGTYYVIPGMFFALDFQSTLVEKLVAGVDLSGNAGLPHVTVAAGETKELEYDDVDVINAVYALP